MSRSITPLPRWIAPRIWPARHSSSSRVSTKWNLSPRFSRSATADTVVSRMLRFASSTSFKKPGECFMASEAYLDGPAVQYHRGVEVIPVHIAVLTIADDAASADRATAQAIAERASTAGHQIVDEEVAADTESA